MLWARHLWTFYALVPPFSVSAIVLSKKCRGYFAWIPFSSFTFYCSHCCIIWPPCTNDWFLFLRWQSLYRKVQLIDYCWAVIVICPQCERCMFSVKQILSGKRRERCDEYHTWHSLNFAPHFVDSERVHQKWKIWIPPFCLPSKIKAIFF